MMSIVFVIIGKKVAGLWLNTVFLYTVKKGGSMHVLLVCQKASRKQSALNFWKMHLVLQTVFISLQEVSSHFEYSFRRNLCIIDLWHYAEMLKHAMDYKWIRELDTLLDEPIFAYVYIVFILAHSSTFHISTLSKIVCTFIFLSLSSCLLTQDFFGCQWWSTSLPLSIQSSIIGHLGSDLPWPDCRWRGWWGWEGAACHWPGGCLSVWPTWSAPAHWMPSGKAGATAKRGNRKWHVKKKSQVTQKAPKGLTVGWTWPLAPPSLTHQHQQIKGCGLFIQKYKLHSNLCTY